MTKPVPDIADVQNALLRQRGTGSSDFDLNPSVQKLLPKGRKLRPAAVLIALIDRPNGLNIILTKRASHLKHHPGQIALPGGKVEASDVNTAAAALREAEEEIGLPAENVKILGALPCHETITSFQVTPIVGHVQRDFEHRPEKGEVDEIFEVPLAHVTNTANFQIQGRLWQGQMRYYYVVPYGPYYIWGATARMLRSFAEELKK